MICENGWCDWGFRCPDAWNADQRKDSSSGMCVVIITIIICQAFLDHGWIAPSCRISLSKHAVFIYLYFRPDLCSKPFVALNIQESQCPCTWNTQLQASWVTHCYTVTFVLQSLNLVACSSALKAYSLIVVATNSDKVREIKGWKHLFKPSEQVWDPSPVDGDVATRCCYACTLFVLNQ